MNISREKLTETLKKVFPFHTIVGDLLALLLDKTELVYFPDGKMIYQEGALAEAFYIVLEGEVEVLKEVHQSLSYKNGIQPFFSFGEDVFTDHARRRTSTRALGDVVLIKISAQVMRALRAQDAQFSSGISRLCASYEYLLLKRFEKIPGETIAYISQPHPLPLALRMIAALILVAGLGILSIYLYNSGTFSLSIFQWLVGIMAAAGLLYMGWSYFEWSNDFFFFSDKRINNTKRTNLVLEEKQDTPLSAIVATQVSRSLLGRSLDYGDLEVKTFTGMTSIPNVPHVNGVQPILQFLISRRSEVVDREESIAFQNEIRARINGGTAKSVNGRRPIAGIQNGDQEDGYDQDELVDGEQGDLVIRTHWTILFSKVFIPVFLIASLLFSYLFIMVNNFSIAESAFFDWVVISIFVFLAGWAGYQFLDWRNDRFIITDDMLIDVDKRPFGTEEKRSAHISRIQSIRFKKKGLFGLLFNFGTVFIRIGDEEFTFDNIHRPSEVQDILFDAREGMQKREEQDRIERDRKRAAGWIDSYHQLIQEENGDDKDDA